MVAEGKSYTVRGEVYDKLFRRLAEERWDEFEAEQLFEGPAGTGKSFAAAIFLYTVACNFPGCRILVVRKTRASLTQSWMVTFEKILGPDHLVLKGARRGNRQSYVFPNGAEIVMGGMDNEVKLFSTEYDIIYGNESNEFTEAQWESLHRALRNGVLPFQILIGDCNPDSEFHWLNQRCFPRPDGHVATARRKTTLRDNPAYWVQREDGTWGWSKMGADYRKRLAGGLTGVRRMRLLDGVWCTAEGAIIDNFSRESHVFVGDVEFPEDRRPRIVLEDGRSQEISFFYGCQDWGFRNPGAFLVCAVEHAPEKQKIHRKVWVVEELYHTRQGEDWWADQVQNLDRKYLLHRIVCDSANPDKIEKFNRVLRASRETRGLDSTPIAIPSGKKSKAGKQWLEIQTELMRFAFGPGNPSGSPMVAFFDKTLAHLPDAGLVGKPTRFMEEIPSWTYEPYDAAKHRGQPQEIGNKDAANHAIDAFSYGLEWLWDHDLPDDIGDRWPAKDYEPGTWGSMEPFLKWNTRR